MCRYAMRDYDTHWACLPCRWTAKHPRPWLPDAPVPSCPRCRSAMVDLGRDFHAPRRADQRQWRKVALLLSGGSRSTRADAAGLVHVRGRWPMRGASSA